MTDIKEGRGQWYREYLLKVHGKKALAEFDQQRVTQASMSEVDDYVAVGPEFDFDLEANYEPCNG